MQTHPIPAWLKPCPVRAKCMILPRGKTAYYSQDCPDCQGTGLKYPGLSTECPRLGQHHRDDCDTCNGTGRIQKQGAEAVAALLEALFTIGGIDLFQCAGKYYVRVYAPGFSSHGDGDTLEAALTLALEAATESRP